MADIRKDQERDELHRAIWAIADELRGAVDGWDFKNYVLGTMFYRYISENLTNYINAGELDAGNTGFDYAKMSDDEAEEARERLVEEKGFFILPSELFCNVNGRADNDENLNETLERVFNHIEASAKGSSSESSFGAYSSMTARVAEYCSFKSVRSAGQVSICSFTLLISFRIRSSEISANIRSSKDIIFVL